MADIINDSVVHDITLINGVKMAIVEGEGVIYLEMYDPEPTTIAKISNSGVHKYGAYLTPDRLDRLLYGKIDKICAATSNKKSIDDTKVIQ